MIKNHNLLSLGMAAGAFASSAFTTVHAAGPRQPHVILIMTDHLAERGPEWSVDGHTVVNPKRVLYSPNFPKSTDKK